jgi:hypothetical protein
LVSSGASWFVETGRKKSRRASVAVEAKSAAFA